MKDMFLNYSKLKKTQHPKKAYKQFVCKATSLQAIKQVKMQ